MSYKIAANYAVPILAAAPVEDAGEFPYNGMRGLGIILKDGTEDAGPSIPAEILADRNAQDRNAAAAKADTFGTKVMAAAPYIAGAVGLAILAKLALGGK